MNSLYHMPLLALYRYVITALPSAVPIIEADNGISFAQVLIKILLKVISACLEEVYKPKHSIFKVKSAFNKIIKVICER